MKIRKLFRLKNIYPYLSNESAYLYGQIKGTYIGLLLVSITWFIYFMAYLLIGDRFLMYISGVNILIFFLLFIYFMREPVQRKVIVANAMLAFLFLNAYPISFLTGGLNSSTVIWIALFPAIMVLMNGIKNAVVWFVLAVILFISLLLFKSTGITKALVSRGAETDRFLDIIMMTFTTTFIISSIEISRKKTIQKLENVQEELRVLATTDPLTGLLNRRFFIELAEAEIKRSVRYKTSLSVLMIDIDHFKAVNDNYGHKAGDLALMKISSLLKSSLRDIDLVGRYGGEEFIILLPESDKRNSLIIAERIRKKIENTEIDINNSEKLHQTVSIGVAESNPEQQYTLDTLTLQADKALYCSKNTGRNKSTVWKEVL